MNFDFIQQATSKELEQFKSVCNQLLSRTYVVRTLYRPGKGRVNNPDYTFLSLHYEAVQDYLGLMDWDLRKDTLNGYFYVVNTDEANRCNLNKKETAILLALRMIYEENQERLGLEQDAICTVRDVLEKVVTDYAILPAKPNMDEVKRALTLLENHAIIQRIDGKFNQSSCKFAILPTVLAAVSGEKLNAVVSVLQKEDAVKKLKKILLINWLYFSKELIEVSDVNFLTGKNGAGKSTVIDALQIVLLGETNARNFNQAANEKSQRTLDGYLRADMDENNPYSRRGKDFSSYIACEFQDEVEGTSFVTGVVFDCRSDGSRQERFFIYVGTLPENCFIENGEAMEIPALRRYLKQNYAKAEIYDTQKEYRRNMLSRWNVHKTGSSGCEKSRCLSGR